MPIALEAIMTTTSKTTTPASTGASSQQAARTDDLLSSGADRSDGARGFDNDAGAEALKTGMENIATGSQGNRQSDSQTLPEQPGQVRNQQKS
jgi:hypothetical protein